MAKILITDWLTKFFCVFLQRNNYHKSSQTSPFSDNFCDTIDNQQIK